MAKLLVLSVGLIPFPADGHYLCPQFLSSPSSRRHPYFRSTETQKCQRSFRRAVPLKIRLLVNPEILFENFCVFCLPELYLTEFPLLLFHCAKCYKALLIGFSSNSTRHRSQLTRFFFSKFRLIDEFDMCKNSAHSDHFGIGSIPWRSQDQWCYLTKLLHRGHDIFSYLTDRSIIQFELKSWNYRNALRSYRIQCEETRDRPTDSNISFFFIHIPSSGSR
jgi:hypothetical protein